MTTTESEAADASTPDHAAAFARRHLRFGWWSLLFFISLGFLLEMLHGFKVGWYLDVSNEVRRLMLTLAHTHGTLVSVVHIVAAATVGYTKKCGPALMKIGSPSLMGASVLLPGGFLLGGIWIFDGDPGYGVFLVPLGALCLFTTVVLMANQVSSARD